MTSNLQWHLVSRPQKHAAVDNFRLVEASLAPLEDGQLRIQHHYISVDPYMRGRMDDLRSYAEPQPLNQVMGGGAVGEVVESRNAGFKSGDQVASLLTGGWQQYGVSDGTGLVRIENPDVPMSAYLGCAGMPGITAWYGVNRILKPKPGETLTVAAASGAVGSVVGQLAKRMGARVVGIAGGPEKCAIARDEFGFDVCIDRKAGNLHSELAAATPDRIDANFENVGGPILDAVLARLNTFSRIALCGLIAGYDGAPMPVENVRAFLVNRVYLQGFIVSDHLEDWPQASAELAQLIADGALHYRESISMGIESTPRAFLGLLTGGNVGKQLVKLV